jgi:hypothetical protein
MKHRHADLIHAWADGAKIQVQKMDTYVWLDDPSPDWNHLRAYRIKPEEKKPVVRWLWADVHGFYLNRFSEVAHGGYNIKLEWSRTEFPE